MSEVRLNILDARRSIYGTVHGSIADSVVAALSAEPETIEELQYAVGRFIKPVANELFFVGFDHGTNEEPWDAGIVLVDLAARIVATESSYSIPLAEGQVEYHNGAQATDICLPYRVPDDWLFILSVAEYETICGRRRAERATYQPLDARPVLYEAVAEFIVRECFAVCNLNLEDPIVEIHTKWLMTPRPDLGGKSPREVMLLKRDFVDADLQSRELQWSFVGEPAPCLKRNSSAYRFAGFGTHEVVIYYELLRLLISKCWRRARNWKNITMADEVARLEQIKTKWLERPHPDFFGKSPAYIVECERKRLPLIMSAKEMVIDDDCPFCRAMAALNKPGFWHLDGCNMDDAFPFSFHRTRDEWDAEKLRIKHLVDGMNLESSQGIVIH
jgi:hypothetical protein